MFGGNDQRRGRLKRAYEEMNLCSRPSAMSTADEPDDADRKAHRPGQELPSGPDGGPFAPDLVVRPTAKLTVWREPPVVRKG